MTNAPSNFGLLYQFENAYARMQGTWNQDLIQPQQFALQRLPDLTVTGRQELFNNLMFADYDAEAVNFYRYRGSRWRALLCESPGHAAVAFGRLPHWLRDRSVRRRLAMTPRGITSRSFPVGTTPPVPSPDLRQRWRRFAVFQQLCRVGPEQRQGTSARVVPYAKAGISTVLDRVYDFQWKSIEKLKNTIEPFANYAYVPRIYQGNQPLFDQTDRLNSRSLITYGFTTRLFAKVKEDAPEETTTDATPTEAITGTGDTNVGPFHEDPLADSLAPRGGSIVRDGEHSQELGSLTIQQAYDVSHEIDAQWIEYFRHRGAAERLRDPDCNAEFAARLQSARAFRDHVCQRVVGIQPPWDDQGSPIYLGKALQGSFIEFAYNYASRNATVFPATAKNAAQFVSGRAYTDVFDRLGVYIAPSYDLADNRALSTEYGVRLKSPCDCWAADLGIIDSTNPNEVQVQFQLTLGGLGSVGRSPFGRNPFQTRGLVGSPTGVLPNY